MIRNFYRYICYSIYKRACKSTIMGATNSRFYAYLNFLTLASIIPGFILTIKIRNLKYFSFLHMLPERGMLNLLLHFCILFVPSMLIISLFVKKSYLENLVLTEAEIKKNRYIFWGIIFLCVVYFCIKLII